MLPARLEPHAVVFGAIEADRVYVPLAPVFGPDALNFHAFTEFVVDLRPTDTYFVAASRAWSYGPTMGSIVAGMVGTAIGCYRGQFDPEALFGTFEDLPKTATGAEELGFDAVYTAETEEDAMLSLPLVAEHTDRVDLGTRVTLAFTRSPMVLAYQGWALQNYSDGRFVLGLGTQVKGHNERRFGVEWTAPGPRLREVVESIRHIWDVWQGEADELDYDGEHYAFSLMTETFDPGPVDEPDVPIYIAAVNEYNVRLAGEICDGRPGQRRDGRDVRHRGRPRRATRRGGQDLRRRRRPGRSAAGARRGVHGLIRAVVTICR